MRAGKSKPPPDADAPLYLRALSYLKGRKLNAAIDGGANVGHWSAWMVRDFRFVMAFEPQAELAAQIRRRLRDMDPLPVFWQVWAMALGAKPGVCAIENPPNRQVSTAAFVRFGESGEPARTAPVLTLDSFNLEHCDLLKLDLEGAEYFAIMGAAETIDRCAPVVVLEESRLSVRHYGVAEDAARKLLEALGYVTAEREGVNVVMVRT